MVDVLTEAGRIVWGNPTRPQNKQDDDGKVILKDGAPIPQYSFGLALPKATFGAVSTAMTQAATGIPGNDQPGFAWKFKDGDTGVDAKGKPLRDKPGYAGCYILAISTEVEAMARVYKQVSPGNWQVMPDGELKTGHWVRVRLDIVGHGPNPTKRGSKAGLYINPRGVEFVGYDQEIFSGPDAAEMFGGAPIVALPPGVSATPVASVSGPPSVGLPPGAPAPIPMQAPPGFPPTVPPVVPPVALPVGLPPGPPVAAPPTAFPSPVPAHDFVQNAMPPGAPAPIPVAPPVAPVAPPAPAPGSGGRIPVAADPATGRPIYGYTLHNGANYPIFGFDPAGNPIYT